MHGWNEDYFKKYIANCRTSSDPAIKLQANNVAKDCYKFIMDMSTNAGIVSDALKYITEEGRISNITKYERRREKRVTNNNNISTTS